MSQNRNLALSVIRRAMISLVLLALAGVVLIALIRTRPQPAASDDARQAQRVIVMSAKTVPIRRQFGGFGTARAIDRSDVPARVAAVVLELPDDVLDGAAVSKGQLLARLDDSDFVRQVEVSTETIKDFDAQLARLAIEQESWQRRVELAREDVELAEGELERVRKALADGGATQIDVDRARQALVVAMRTQVGASEEMDKIAPRRASMNALKLREEALLRLAKQNVERCRIESPLNGVIEVVDIREGESLQPGQRVARVVSLELIEVPLRLPASARAEVTVGDDVTLTAESASGRSAGSKLEWRGRVSRISPQDDEATRTMTVFVEIAQRSAPGRHGQADRSLPVQGEDTGSPRQSEPLLVPGKFVQGTLTTGRELMRTIVPVRAISSERLLLVEDGQIVARDVAIEFRFADERPEFGVRDRQWAALQRPLPDGAMVVLSAPSTVTVGSRVQPVPADDSVIAGSAEPAPATVSTIKSGAEKRGAGPAAESRQ